MTKIIAVWSAIIWMNVPSSVGVRLRNNTIAFIWRHDQGARVDRPTDRSSSGRRRLLLLYSNWCHLGPRFECLSPRHCLRSVVRLFVRSLVCCHESRSIHTSGKNKPASLSLCVCLCPSYIVAEVAVVVFVAARALGSGVQIGGDGKIFSFSSNFTVEIWKTAQRVCGWSIP